METMAPLAVHASVGDEQQDSARIPMTSLLTMHASGADFAGDIQAFMKSTKVFGRSEGQASALSQGLAFASALLRCLGPDS